MKKNLSLTCLILLLTSCNNINSNSLSESSKLNSSSSSSEVVSTSSINTISNSSSTSSILSSSSTSTNAIDYSLFDENIIGTWYVHSSAQGLLEINNQIIINSSYEATIFDIHFNFIGLYENFAGACLFLSDSGATQLIASSDEEGFLDWGIIDSQGNQDFGYAKKEEHVSGIQYSYEGEEWPIELIKEYLSIDKDIPVFEHNYYYLYTGTSQLYDDIYCMIDIFGVSANARDSYALQLEEAGYVFTLKEGTFYDAYDEEKTYAIRLSQYDDNLCIFVYYYSTLYK